MISSKIPAILAVEKPNNSISMERAMKQILELLESMTAESDSQNDRIEASIDDVNVILEHIDRS
jgi:hypothetical protein